MKGSYRFRRVGKAAAACTLSLMLAFPTPAVAFATTSTEIQQQIATVRETLSGYYTEAEMCQNDLVTVKQQLKETEEKIAELNKQIPETESSFKDAQSKLAKHVNETYKSGNPSLLDVILQATSFEDLVSRITYANKVAERGNTLVEEAKGLFDELTRQRLDLETARASLSSLEDEQENRLQALNAATEELENYQSQLSDDLKAKIAEEEAEERRKAEEAAAAARAEAQRKADAEAAALKAAQEQQQAEKQRQQQEEQQRQQQEAQKQAEQQQQQQQQQGQQPEQQQPNAEPEQPAAPETPQTPAQDAETPQEPEAPTQPETPQEPETPTQPENTQEESQQQDQTQSDDSSDDYSSYGDDSSSSYTSTGSAASLVARAYSIIGSGYSYSGYNWTGSTSSSTFTCSGVVDYALGLPSWSNSPETLYAQVGSALVTDTSQLNYGDLVFYSYAGRYPGHVGIYIGGGSIIDSIPNGGVQIRDVNYMDCMGGGPIV